MHADLKRRYGTVLQAALLSGLALWALALAAPPPLVSATAVTTHAIASGAEVTPDAADASNGNKCLNDGTTRLVMTNASGATRTLTITPAATFWNGQLTFAPYTKTVADGKVGVFGPFPPSLFNDASGYLFYSVDSSTSVTITPVKD